jgi:hypothetical protein
MLPLLQMATTCDPRSVIFEFGATSDLLDALKAKLERLASTAQTTLQLEYRGSHVQHVRQLFVELLQREDAVHHAVQLEHLLGYILPDPASAPSLPELVVSANLQAWLDAGLCQALRSFYLSKWL